MAHAQIPEEELKPLLTSLERILKPIIDVVPALTMVPSELDRIGDNLDDDIMSGVPERLESVAERFTMDLGTKILAMQEEKVQSFGSRMLKIQDELARKEEKQQSIRTKFLQSVEMGKQMNEERNQNRLLAFQERGMAVEIKNDRVQFINQEELQKKQKENLNTQTEIIREEKKVQQLIDSNGNEEEIARGIEKLVQLEEKDRKESQTLGSKKKIKGEGGLGAEDFLPAPLLEGFTTLKDSINDTKETLVSFAKPITGAIKLFKQRAEIMEKLRKFSIKELALKTKQFVIDKAKFALDVLSVLTNPFVLIGATIAGLVATLVEFGPEIKDFFMGIINDISDFFTETIPNFFKDMFDDIYMAIPSFLGGASDEEEKAIMEERAGRKSAIDQDVNPMAALNKTESSDDKLKRLKQQQQQQELDGAVSNIVNVANSTNNNTAVAVNPTVPKSTSADAMALNA